MVRKAFSGSYTFPHEKSAGEIIIDPGTNAWPDEMKTAKALGSAGYTVRFNRRSKEQ